MCSFGCICSLAEHSGSVQIRYRFHRLPGRRLAWLKRQFPWRRRCTRAGDDIPIFLVHFLHYLV
ncbi:ORF930 [White spot syndrome virus]|uniref:ORF930 n=1 Tax=White spot syndrome virus TaxID=342409 RepID=A0A2D3I6U2_9VIRU|nr:ORF930 [White spot syndrome virus]